MKDHEKVILASAGGVFLYLLMKDKPFRKCVIKVCQEFAKEAAAESSDKPTINTASTVAKKGKEERS